jgi:hypothetical protein
MDLVELEILFNKVNYLILLINDICWCIVTNDFKKTLNYYYSAAIFIIFNLNKWSRICHMQCWPSTPKSINLCSDERIGIPSIMGKHRPLFTFILMTPDFHCTSSLTYSVQESGEFSVYRSGSVRFFDPHGGQPATANATGLTQIWGNHNRTE